MDSSGEQRIVRYSAGKHGFSIDSDEPVGGLKPASQPMSSFSTTTQHNPVIPPASLTRYLTPPQQIPVPQPTPQLQPAQAPVSQSPPPSPPPHFNPATLSIPPPPPPSPAPAPAPQTVSFSQPSSLSQGPYAGAQQFAPQPPQFRLPQPQNNQINFPPPPPSFISPIYQPRPNIPSPAAQTGTPLSAFPELPGVRLIQINRRPSLPEPQNQNSYSSNSPSNFAPSLASNFQSSSPQSFQSPSFEASSASTTSAPEEYGPVVINAALLSYDIGTAKRQA